MPRFKDNQSSSMNPPNKDGLMSNRKTFSESANSIEVNKGTYIRIKSFSNFFNVIFY